VDKKVLVVDDEERVVQSITGVLEDEGFQVASAKSGKEAIEIFQQEKPDVTLVDIWMPGMDGMEVLKRLKGISPDCQVIMISGHATISTAMTAVKLGAFDFIEKPVSLDLLLQTIHRALDQPKELMAIQPVEENTLQQTLFPKEVGEEMVNGSPTPLRPSTFPFGETSKGKGGVPVPPANH
jgi:two-component system nitrogen regulation response regulator NtrX